MNKIKENMKEFLHNNEDLLQLNPTEFLIKAERDEKHTFDVPDLISFIEIFDESGIPFQVEKLFNSEPWDFTDKYIKKGISQKDLMEFFNKEILEDPILNKIVTEIPPHLFENLNNEDIQSAIKNTMLCYKIGTLSGDTKSIGIRPFLSIDDNKITIAIEVKSNGHALYNYFETMGVWIPNYGFMINKNNFFKKINEISKLLHYSLSLVNKEN